MGVDGGRYGAVCRHLVTVFTRLPARTALPALRFRLDTMCLHPRTGSRLAAQRILPLTPAIALVLQP